MQLRQKEAEEKQRGGIAVPIPNPYQHLQNTKQLPYYPLIFQKSLIRRGRTS